jgi:DNA-binding MarR family transcriptional regulator
VQGRMKEKRLTVTLRQREVLTHVLKRHQMSIGELASRLGVSYVAVIKLVNRLERKQLVQRKTDEWDRRRTLLILTEGGKSIIHD